MLNHISEAISRKNLWRTILDILYVLRNYEQIVVRRSIRFVYYQTVARVRIDV